jgi:hypothetical protein
MMEVRQPGILLTHTIRIITMVQVMMVETLISGQPMITMPSDITTIPIWSVILILLKEIAQVMDLQSVV